MSRHFDVTGARWAKLVCGCHLLVGGRGVVEDGAEFLLLLRCGPWEW